MKTFLPKSILTLLLFLGSFLGFSQEYTPFTRAYTSGDSFRYQTNIKGDLTFIANNILNRDDGTATTRPVDAYNDTGVTSEYNDRLNMRFIDVDADADTFNSSSAELTFGQPDCNRIRYAGLYWSATYVSNEDGTRSADFNQVKFQVPGGNYVDVIADEVLFDTATSNHPLVDQALRQSSPYACYADVTAQVTALADPSGTYTVGNIRASQGFGRGFLGGTLLGGATGGWTLVIVYENPTLTGKLITTYDGFARIRTENPSLDINYSGFTTIPAGPVEATIGAAALEGDNRITGDELLIRAALNSSGPFYSIGNNLNPTTPTSNFFNSNITTNDMHLPGRNPASINTLGYDTDLIDLQPNVIPNNETDATFRFTTATFRGDQYFPFFNSFNIEIIEPEIVLEKEVQNIAGDNITGLGVHLGQVLDYVLSFENIGNDDADNYTIRDVLPINVTLNENYWVQNPTALPTGVDYTFDPATRTVVFTIPNNLVTDTSPVASIRMRVRVAQDCFDFIDACTDLIQNVAFSTYQGVINDNQITDDPSVTEFNSCGFIIPGATNFLLDNLADCGFRSTVLLCGVDAVLEAGEGFDRYVWVSDDNENGLIDTTDTVLADGTSNSITITETGTYIVDKIVRDPCKGFKEIFEVSRFGDDNPHPIIEYFNSVNSDADPSNNVQGEIVSCSVDGDMLPKIFLCGTNDAQLLRVNIADASIVWEKLDEASCSATAVNDCANKNGDCDWDNVATGSTYNASTEGEYRLVVTYEDGCFNRFYFNVFQNTLDINYTTRDVICETEGNITITNIGSGYGFQLIDVATNTIAIPFSANNGPVFNFTSNGSYRVEVTQMDTDTGLPIDDACIFSTEPIGIRIRDFQVDITTTQANCNAQGSIQVDALNVEGPYSYELRLDDGTPAPSVGSPDYYPSHPGGTLIDSETAQPVNSYTFSVNAGAYFVVTRTEDNCFDVQAVEVTRIPDPTLTALTTADIGCSFGSIELTKTGGRENPGAQYAIWSKNGTVLHNPGGAATEQEILDNIDLNAYQLSNIFTFGWRDTDGDTIEEYFAGEEGTYVFVVRDANGCYALSNPTTINDLGAFSIDSIDEVQPSCSGEADGQLTINTLGGVAPFRYSIDNGVTYQPTATFVGLTAGPNQIRVLDDSGCVVISSYDLEEPFPLSASAGVARDATCDALGAEARITNVVGGTAPYQYSFDGGNSWGPASTTFLLPGDYSVIVRDSSCSYTMALTVEGLPQPPNVTLTPEVSYNCNGTGTITASPSISDYTYRYALDGVDNTPDTSNVFTNVPPGTYTVTTYYRPSTPPTPSLLLSEDFGYGSTIPNPNTAGYFYENQLDNTSPSGAPIDSGRAINDYEYAVTDSIASPFGAWINPIDHTTGTRATDGRYLVINIGAPLVGQVIYRKAINDIIPGQPIEVSMWLINLIRRGNRIRPDLTIQLIDPNTGDQIDALNTGPIPENSRWNERILPLNPGAFTSLDLVIVTNVSETSGNDVAIDDITVHQTPEVCELSVSTPVTVEAGLTFAAGGESSTNVSCNGGSDGTITFEMNNFNATAGFQYSVDGTTWITSTSSQVTTDPVFGAGTHTILVRKTDEVTCTTTVTQTITEPSALEVTASITTDITCANGATISAIATGGTLSYDYQLEDSLGNAIAPYGFVANGTNRVFTNLPAGVYVVRAMDGNNCIAVSNTAIEVLPLNPVAFTTVPTVCYDGTNNATIQVNVTNGNGGYQFRIGATGPWLTPTPASDTTYTFNNLSNGSYDIDVRDENGCPLSLATQTVVINSALSVSASAPNISACDTASDITITANGGDGNYTFAVMASGDTPSATDFNTSNPVTGFAAGNYDVYVRDNNGNTNYCSASFPLTITQDAPINFTPMPTDVTCFGGTNGAISVVLNSGGQAPFTYSIDNGVSYRPGTNFSNLSAGTYQVRVMDANLCESVAIAIAVDQPDELVAEALQTQAYTCAQLGQITVGSINPTTGGSGDYQYRINGGSWTASTTGGHTFTDLTDGSYSIHVRDANTTSCAITLATVVIDALPIAPIVDYSVVYNCDGTGNVTITPFDATFIYTLSGTAQGPGSASNTFNNIAVGTQTLRVEYSPDCFVDTTVIIENGNAFEASIISFNGIDCNGDASGSITINAANYGAGGFQYSINGGAFFSSFTSAQTITGLTAQTHNIVVQDVNDPTSCTIPLSQVLTEPAALQVNAGITTEFTCNNTGATITATTTGGTPTYQYQLEISNDADFTAPYVSIVSIERAFQNSPVFTNVPESNTGESYVIRVRDSNNCEDVIDTAITVTDPELIVFDTTPTACYSGNNDGSITVNVTAGNGGYQFRLDGGTWMAPELATPTSYTFQNLANGSFTIEVRDQFGCPLASNLQTVVLNPDLNATVNVVDLSCTDGSLTVTATGGDGNYVYAFMQAGNTPAFTDFGASNTYAVTTGYHGNYDVYVWDNNGIDPHCTIMVTETVAPAVALTYTATPTDPQCFDGTGSITVNISSGDSPYTIELIDLDNAGAANQTSTNVVGTTQNYFNLPVGNYTIIVTDVNGCDQTETPVTITNPDELTATLESNLSGDCSPATGFRFTGYPTTLEGTLQFSHDGGATWQLTDNFDAPSHTFTSGDNVFPVIRTVDVSGNTLCRTDFDRYIITYPLDDLDITVSAVLVGCNELQVTVLGEEGTEPYEYAYSEDATTFNPGLATWFPGSTVGKIIPPSTIPAVVPVGEGNYVWTGLIPGRSYTFYVRDSNGCVRQSLVNVNDLIVEPINIEPVYEATCAGDLADITYNLTLDSATPLPTSMRWELYNLTTGSIVVSSGNGTTSSLAGTNVPYVTSIPVVDLPTTTTVGPNTFPAEYFMVLTLVDGGGTDTCIGGSENLVIDELDPISFTPNVVVDITCANPGLIEIQNPQGGGGSYIYTLSSTNFNADIVSTSTPIEVPIANLINPTTTPFDVDVNVTDQFGCTVGIQTVSIDVSQSPTVTSTTNNCATPFGITVNASGGTAPYLYSIDGGTRYRNNGGVFNNVPVGVYTISIIDANGCTATNTAEIYPTLQASAVLVKTLDCTGTPEATIRISASNGSGSYDYEITGPVNLGRATVPSPTNTVDWSTAVAGTYTVLVYDNNRPTCPPRTFMVEVPTRLEPIVDTLTATAVTCIGDTDGTINISVVDNAIGPYTFLITSLDGAATSITPTSTTNTSATFTGLAASTGVGYQVTVTANTANACSTNSTLITIAEPAAIAVTMNTPIEFGCTTGNNLGNASISVQNVTGGSNTFVRYQFFNDLDLGTPVQDGANDTYIETNTAGGNYTIIVFDDNGCQGTTTATIAPLDELLPATITENLTISCIAGENITINAFGSLTNSSTAAGLANYEFRQLPNAFGATNVFTGLPTGTHTFEVRNVNTNCVVTIQHTVGEPNNFNITVATTNVICDSTNGTAIFSIADPINTYTGGFDYQVFEQITNTPQTTVLTHLNPGPTAAVDLPAGDYYVVITQNGNPLCSNPQNFSIAGPNGAITGNTQVEPITCALNDGVIEVINAQGGWGGYTYFVALATNPQPLVGDFVANPRFTGLSDTSGTGTAYQVWIKDQNDCMLHLPDVTLINPENITADLQVNQGNCTNFSGELQVVNVFGGQGSNYTYQLLRAGIAFRAPQATTVFSGLGAGSYQVRVTDQWGCAFTTTAAVLYDVIAPRADILKTIDCNSGGSISITQTGGSGIFDYTVTFPGTSTPQPPVLASASATFTNLTAVGDYVFTITDTATGHTCSTTVTQRLEDRVLPNIRIDDFTEVTCNGANDGIIRVNAAPDNGIGPYTFTIISGPGTSSTAYPIAATSTTNTTAVFAGLEGTVAGITYTVRVTTPNGCFRDIEQTIRQPNVISNLSVSSEQFECTVGNIANTARISVDLASLSGGSGNFVRFRFVNTTTGRTVQDGSNSTYVATNYAGGVYEITAFDEMGCASPVATETIDPFIQISNPTVTPLALLSCNPGTDAEIQVNITVNPATATPNLEYALSAMDLTNTTTNTDGRFSGLVAGNYRIRITNLDTNCVIDTVHTIDAPEKMQVRAIKLTDEQCLNNGVDDGSFSIAITNFTGAYSYQVLDGSNNPVVGLAGIGNTATALPPFFNLPSGVYYVRVTQTDAPHCVENSNAITIVAPSAPIAVVPVEVLGVSCSNDKGSVSVIPTGGEAPYTIDWINTVNGRTGSRANVRAFVFSGLSAGDYTFTVTDAFGCAETATIRLVRPEDLAATISATTLSCFGGNDGSVTATLGTRTTVATYQYRLNVYSDMTVTTPLRTTTRQPSATFTGLGSGFYSITVLDNLGCVFETLRVQIAEPTEVFAQLFRTSELTCTTLAQLELTATGGTGPYSYSVDGIAFTPMNALNGPNTHVFSNVAAGTYRYFVRDDFNCASIVSNEIKEDPIVPLSVTVNNASAFINCTGDSTASIFAQADGGLGNYQYALYTNVSLNAVSRIAGPQQNGVFNGLAAGTYYVEVTSGDCTAAPEEVIIAEPVPLTYTDQVTNISCFGENDGSLTVTLSGGAGGYQYAISPNLRQFESVNTFTDLSPGEYTIIAQDANGCFEELKYTLTQPTLLELDATPTSEVCVGSADGIINLTISGGTAPYSTSLNSNDDADFVQDRVRFSTLEAGNYLVFVRDANGCEANVVVDIDAGVNLNATITPVYECMGDTPTNYLNITLDDQNVIGDVLYALNSTNPADMQLNPDFRNTPPGTHYIAIAHANGCVQTFEFEIEAFEPLALTLVQSGINQITATATGGRPGYTYYLGDQKMGEENTFTIYRTDTYVITVVDETGCETQASIAMEFIEVEFPNFFTPDGTGQNDFWIPRNMETYPEIIIIIFDRYGREVYRMGANGPGWDGLYQESELPTGDYWYVVKLNGVVDNRELIGHFTLYR